MREATRTLTRQESSVNELSSNDVELEIKNGKSLNYEGSKKSILVKQIGGLELQLPKISEA